MLARKMEAFIKSGFMISWKKEKKLLVCFSENRTINNEINVTICINLKESVRRYFLGM